MKLMRNNEVHGLLSKLVAQINNDVINNSNKSYNEKEVHILGSKDVAEKMIPLLTKNNIRVISIMDSEINQIGKKLHDIEVMPIEKTDHPTVICAYNSDKVSNELQEKIPNLIKWNELILYSNFKFCLPYYAITQDLRYLKKNTGVFHKIIDQCVDEKSQLEFMNQIASRFGSEIPFQSLPAHDSEPEYFVERYSSIIEGSTFLDLGAFQGDTLKVFLENYSSKYQNNFKYVCVEPDFYNFKELIQNFSETENIEVFNALIGRKLKLEDFLSFGTLASSLFETQSTGKSIKRTLPVFTIDFLAERFNITHVKMDIEGSEIEALKGAKRLIKKRKTTFIMAAYHRYNDLTKLSSIFSKKYKFAFTSHAQRPWDSTMYAIPIRN